MVAIFEDPYILAAAIAGATLLGAFAAYIILSFLNKRFSGQNEYMESLPLRKMKWTVILYIIFAGGIYVAKSLPQTTPITNYLNDGMFVLSVFVAALLITQIVSAIIHRHVKHSKQHTTTPKILDLIVSIIIFTVAIITILQYFNVQITAIIATLGIGGIAVGLALQGTLANLFAGIHLITTEPVRVGDFIEIEYNDLKGYVVDIGWRETKLRQINNCIVIIPNNKLAESVIVNDSMPEEELTMSVQVGVDYTSDLEHVQEITMKIAKQIQEEIPVAVSTWEPKVEYHTFADSNINFAVYLRVQKYFDKRVVTHEFIKKLKKAYDEEGIEISWPIRKVYNK